MDSGKGVYIAVGGNPIHPSFSARLIALPLREPSAVTEVHVAWRRDEQAKTTLDFLQFTRDAFRNKQGFMQGQNGGHERANWRRGTGRALDRNGKRKKGQGKR